MPLWAGAHISAGSGSMSEKAALLRPSGSVELDIGGGGGSDVPLHSFWTEARKVPLNSLNRGREKTRRFAIPPPFRTRCAVLSRERASPVQLFPNFGDCAGKRGASCIVNSPKVQRRKNAFRAILLGLKFAYVGAFGPDPGRWLLRPAPEHQASDPDKTDGRTNSVQLMRR